MDEEVIQFKSMNINYQFVDSRSAVKVLKKHEESSQRREKSGFQNDYIPNTYVSLNFQQIVTNNLIDILGRETYD